MVGAWSWIIVRLKSCTTYFHRRDLKSWNYCQQLILRAKIPTKSLMRYLNSEIWPAFQIVRWTICWSTSAMRRSLACDLFAKGICTLKCLVTCDMIHKTFSRSYHYCHTIYTFDPLIPTHTADSDHYIRTQVLSVRSSQSFKIKWSKTDPHCLSCVG